MAEMENKTNEVIDVEENTGLVTTAPVQTEPEKPADKVGIIGKVCTGIAVVSSLVAVGIKGYLKGKKKSAKTSKENVVDIEEPTNSEDEVSE